MVISPWHCEGCCRFRNSPDVVDAEKGGGLLPTVHAAVSAEEVTASDKLILYYTHVHA